MRGRNATPWALSLAFHLVAALLFVWVAASGIWRWRSIQQDPLAGPATSFTVEPVVDEPTKPSTTSSQSTRGGASLSEPPTAALPELSAGATKVAPSFDDLARSVPHAWRGPSLPKDIVSIAGVRQEAARRVVFLIDASGSMIGAYPSAVEELIASLARMSDEQFAGVIAFRSGTATNAPPGDLVRMGPTFGKHGRGELRRWLLDEIAPSGSSDPRAALRAAIALKPDSVVIVSAGLLGAGDLPSDRDGLLADLEALNPRDKGTLRRPIQFACVHLMDPEPLGALSAIARDHGAPGAYRFIPRLSEIAAPSDVALPTDETHAEFTAAMDALAKGETARARIALLRLGLGQPLHRSSPLALVSAAEISLLNDKDPRSALALASTAREAATAFGISAVAARAESIARTAAEALKSQRTQITTP